jgi:hypothetical protein
MEKSGNPVTISGSHQPFTHSFHHPAKRPVIAGPGCTPARTGQVFRLRHEPECPKRANIRLTKFYLPIRPARASAKSPGPADRDQKFSNDPTDRVQNFSNAIMIAIASVKNLHLKQRSARRGHPPDFRIDRD